MCLGVPHPPFIPRFRAPSPLKPDCHLLLSIDGLAPRSSELVEALLRVDLGARIQMDPTNGLVRVEGRFWKVEVLQALQTLGFSIEHVEEQVLRGSSAN